MWMLVDLHNQQVKSYTTVAFYICSVYLMIVFAEYSQPNNDIHAHLIKTVCYEDKIGTAESKLSN